MWKITKKPITANFSKTNEKIKYIVLHDTGNASPSANAMAHWKYFNDKTAEASYHYVCDENIIIECVGKGFAAYHAGVGKSGLRKDGTISLITNYNSIGVSYCICKGCNIKKAAKNAAIAAAYVCREYGLQPSDIVRHYDVTNKLCPGTMRNNEVGLAQGEGLPPWEDFEAFKLLVGEILEGMNEAEKLCQSLIERNAITNSEYWLDALSGTGDIEIKWLRILLQRLID